MKVLTTDKVMVKALAGTWMDLVHEPRVKALAKSIKKGMQLQEPMVRKSDMTIVFGNGRVAAHHINGEDLVLVKLVDCTDEEAAIAKETENALRVHDPKAQREAEARLLKLLLEETPDIPRRHRGPGPRTKEGWAMTVAARIAEVPLGTLRVRKFRREQVKYVLQPDTVKSFGKPWDKDEFSRLQDAYSTIEKAKKHLQRSNQLLHDLLKISSVQTAKVVRLKAEMTEVNHDLGTLAPTSICPTCKAIPIVKEECAACEATGFITKLQETMVPKKLWDPCILMYRGQERLVEDFEEPSEAAAPGPSTPHRPEPVAAASEDSFWGQE